MELSPKTIGRRGRLGDQDLNASQNIYDYALASTLGTLMVSKPAGGRHSAGGLVCYEGVRLTDKRRTGIHGFECECAHVGVVFALIFKTRTPRPESET